MGRMELSMIAGIIAVLVCVSTFVSLAIHAHRVLSRANLLGTIVHEAGHAVLSVATGGEVRRLTITSRNTGSTLAWTPRGLSSIVTSAAGYAMPPLAGLGAAELLHRGHADAVLIITVVLMGLLLPVTQDLLTVASVLGVGLVAFGAARWGSVDLREFLAYAEAWLLSTSEIGGLAAIVLNRLRGATGTDDATLLASDTHIPGVVWIVGWFGLIGWALWHAVPLLCS